MSLIKRMRKQKAVWWRKVAANRFGVVTWANPVEIACRWTDISEQVLDPKGEVFVSRSFVYVDRYISIGDRIRLGTLIDIGIGGGITTVVGEGGEEILGEGGETVGGEGGTAVTGSGSDVLGEGGETVIGEGGETILDSPPTIVTVNPLLLRDAFEVRKFDDIPNFKAKEHLLMATL